jgi:ATP-dependent 26S proteasome regulatory subunit
LSLGARLLANNAEIEIQIQSKTHKKQQNSLLPSNTTKKLNLQSDNADFESMIQSEIKSIGKKMYVCMCVSFKSCNSDAFSSSWDDIARLQSVKASVKELIEWPLKYAAHFSSVGLQKKTQGLLLFGPPGTGYVIFVPYSYSISDFLY